MSGLFKGFIMALSMFTIIPMPQNSWDDDAARYMTVFLPATGIIIGILWYGVYALLTGIGAGNGVMACLLVSFPYLATGFLHLDGFMDTNDAILSRRGLEERRRILKDSHTGAFGVVSLAVLMLICFGSALTMLENGAGVGPLFFAPGFVRGVAGLFLIILKPLQGSSLGAFFKEKSRKRDIGYIAVIMGAMLCICFMGWGLRGAAACVIAMAASGVSGIGAYKNLGGFSGDLSGFCITIGECACYLLLALW